MIDGPMQQNPDGSWTPAEPLPWLGWKAKLESRLRARAQRYRQHGGLRMRVLLRAANLLAAWDERGLGR